MSSLLIHSWGRRRFNVMRNKKVRGAGCGVRSLGAAGFTLLEVMVALAILAIGIVTVMELFTGSLALGAKASRYTQGVIYAQQVMDRLFAHTTLKNGEENGELPGGYVWLARVQEIRPDDNNATQSSRFESQRRNPIDFFHLKEIEVSVRWEENGAPQVYTLRSLRTVVEQPSELGPGN